MTDQMTDQMKETHNYIDEMNAISELIEQTNVMIDKVGKRTKHGKSYKQNISLMYDEIDRLYDLMLRRAN